MGNPLSWLIFVVGLLAVALFGVALLIALIVGLISVAKKLFAMKESNSVQRAESGDPVSTELSADNVAYHVITDTVTGLNVRKRDNRFQAIFVSISVVLLAGIGAVSAAVNRGWDLPWIAGALIGAFAGLIIGILASGTLLMVYRTVRHMQGIHE